LFCFVDIGGIVDHPCLNFINKTKQSLNRDGQQFHQYQQNKRKFKQGWSSIPPISTKQKKV
jgi:hypothetical protein